MSDPRFVTAADLETFRDQERLNTKRMIEDAIAASNQQQEERWRNMEGRLLKSVRSTITDSMEPYVAEHRNAVLRQNMIETALFGDKARDGVLDTINQLKGEVSAQIGGLKEAVTNLAGALDYHDNRIEHLEGVEKAVVMTLRFVGGTIHKFVTARVIRLLPMLIGIVFTVLASVGFYLQFLFSMYK